MDLYVTLVYYNVMVTSAFHSGLSIFFLCDVVQCNREHVLIYWSGKKLYCIGNQESTVHSFKVLDLKHCSLLPFWMQHIKMVFSLLENKT